MVRKKITNSTWTRDSKMYYIKRHADGIPVVISRKDEWIKDTDNDV